MQIQTLLLLQLQASVESHWQTQIEMLGLIAGKLDNLPNDGIELLIRQQKDDSAAYENKLLLKLIQIYQQFFGKDSPDLSGLTPEQLMAFLLRSNN